MPEGTTILTMLANFGFTVPTSAASRGGSVEIVVTVADDAVLIASKGAALEGADTMAAFPVRAFLLGGYLIFGAEDLFWRESWMSMDTSDDSLSSDSSSNKWHVVLVSSRISSGNR